MAWSGQRSQVTRPAPSATACEYVPTGQGSHVELRPADALKVPMAQTSHVVAADAPVNDVHIPIGQLTQASGPIVSLNVPAAQALQTPPFAPVNPAMHLHCEILVLPAGLVALNGHGDGQADAKLDAPCTVPYIAGGQAAQSPELEEPCRSLKRPAVHWTHAADVLWPVADDHVPAGHSSHAADPVVPLNVPAAQAQHDGATPVAPMPH